MPENSNKQSQRNQKSRNGGSGGGGASQASAGTGSASSSKRSSSVKSQQQRSSVDWSRKFSPQRTVPQHPQQISMAKTKLPSPSSATHQQMLPLSSDSTLRLDSSGMPATVAVAVSPYRELSDFGICDLSIHTDDTILCCSSASSLEMQDDDPMNIIQWNRRLLAAQVGAVRRRQQQQQDAGSDAVAASTDRQQAALLNTRLEVERLHFLSLCREKHKVLCTEVAGIAPPKESFNRWIFERRMQPEYMGDPLLPALFEPIIGPSLKREILEDMPVKVNMFARESEDAAKSVAQYVKAARQLLEQSLFEAEQGNGELRQLSDMEIEQYNAALDEAEQACKAVRRGEKSADCVMELFKSIKERLEPLITHIVEPLVDNACIQLANYADEQHDMFRRHQEQVITRSLSATQNLGRLSLREQRDGFVLELSLPQGSNCVTANLNRVFVRKMHYWKLWHLFDLWNTRRSGVAASAASAHRVPTDEFHARLFTLLQRYETMLGNGKFEGGGFQAALPETVFKTLHELFDVRMECFASPMNCYFPQYCSAFVDTDVYFGSAGSFFEFCPRQGSFEANPPFTEEVMLSMAIRIDELLAATTLPLSFIVFVPNWVDAGSLRRMGSSKWLRAEFVSGAFAHGYVTGLQHKPDAYKREYIALHETHVFFLQNETGFAAWEPTARRIEQLKAAMVRNSG